jgi:hypothetical protein
MDNNKLEELEGEYDPYYYESKSWKHKLIINTIQMHVILSKSGNQDRTMSDVQKTYLPIFLEFKYDS